MTGHALLDLALVVLLLTHAVRGWHVGALTSVLGVAGLLAGAATGLWAVPRLLERWGDGLTDPLPSVLLLGGVLMSAILGESTLGQVGVRLRARARGEGARRLDSGLGSMVSMLVVCIVVTLLGSAVRPLLPKEWAAVANRSSVLPVMDRLTPEQARRWATTVTRTVSESGLPEAFSGLAPEPVIPVDPPDTKAATTAGVRRAAASIVKIQADAPSCSQTHAGSGWVVAGHRVVTNAHVVAGADETTVQVGGTGRRLSATVVAFDPDLDLAILDVPGLEAPALRRAPRLESRQDAVVAGFPKGGPYTVKAARVRGVVKAAGDDIYGGKGVTREVYSVAGTVLPGNSGGPMLTTDGRVAGTVFARSMVDHSTGYVLTDAATDDLLDRAASFHTPVGTGTCAKV